MSRSKLLIIPDRNRIAEYAGLAEQYRLGFEYNDFFSPGLLEDEEAVERVIEEYLRSDRQPGYCTVHGAFLDITIFSDDPLIYKASDYRVEQSLCIAEKIGAGAVIFHTNYIANFRNAEYRESFVSRNAAYWTEKLSQHPGLSIYVENMFDDTPELLAALGEKMKEHPRFGICFDYAHAHVFGDENHIEEWVKTLAPYIRHVHINDNHCKTDEHLAIGDGNIDWRRFLLYREKYFPEATILLEVKGMDKIKESMEYLKSLTNIKSITVKAKLTALDELRKMVEEELSGKHCPPGFIRKIMVCVEELFVNITNYAYTLEEGFCRVDMQTAGTENAGYVRITLRDGGVPFNPLEKEEPDISLSAEERQIGGLGILMVKKIMDTVTYEYKDKQNVVTMEKRWQA